MNKDFGEKKLLSFPLTKQFRILYELSRYIEQNQENEKNSHFQKLSKYHDFLVHSEEELMTKLNKEFKKVIGPQTRQFQIYLMNLERFLEMSCSDYQFMVDLGDKQESTKSFDIICLLDSVRSAYNVGSMMRNSECFGLKKILLTGLSPQADLPQVKKTAMQSDQYIESEYYTDALTAIKKYKELGYSFWSVETEKDSQELAKIKEVPDKLVLVFGHEIYGVSPKLLEQCERSLRISLHGHKNSLNVAISQGIVLNHLTQLS